MRSRENGLDIYISGCHPCELSICFFRETILGCKCPKENVNLAYVYDNDYLFLKMMNFSSPFKPIMGLICAKKV